MYDVTNLDLQDSQNSPLKYDPWSSLTHLDMFTTKFTTKKINSLTPNPKAFFFKCILESIRHLSYLCFTINSLKSGSGPMLSLLEDELE